MVTILLTEAELLAPIKAVKEILFINRMVKDLKLCFY